MYYKEFAQGYNLTNTIAACNLLMDSVLAQLETIAIIMKTDPSVDDVEEAKTRALMVNLSMPFLFWNIEAAQLDLDDASDSLTETAKSEIAALTDNLAQRFSQTLDVLKDLKQNAPSLFVDKHQIN